MNSKQKVTYQIENKKQYDTLDGRTAEYSIIILLQTPNYYLDREDECFPPSTICLKILSMPLDVYTI